MNKALKRAWFNLILTLVIVALHAVAFVLIFKIGYVPRMLNTIGFFVVFGLIGIGAVVFKRKQKLSAVDFDERDHFINKRVLAIDYFLLWSLLIGGCVGSWFLMGPEGVVRIYVLCFLVYVSFLAAMLVHSVTTIIMYCQGAMTAEPLTKKGESNE